MKLAAQCSGVAPRWPRTSKGPLADIYGDGRAYEVEFSMLDGKTAAVVTVEAADVRP